MTITVNGEKKSLKEGMSVLSLVESLNLNPGAVAVQRNDEILLRDDFGSVQLCEGDVIEIVRFVGGG
jgi:thiamine biosynthesis protein ThiS